jgi:hypothetical protein
MSEISRLYPTWEVLDMPSGWPEQTIIWRQENPWERDGAYAAQINTPGTTYLVREVLMSRLPLEGETLSDTPARTRGEAEDAVEEGQRQLQDLLSVGLRPADIQWHVHYGDSLLVLARVAVIDGMRSYLSEERGALRQQIRSYVGRGALIVSDWGHIDQYVQGVPRIDEQRGRAFYLVDPDISIWETVVPELHRT